MDKRLVMGPTADRNQGLCCRGPAAVYWWLDGKLLVLPTSSCFNNQFPELFRHFSSTEMKFPVFFVTCIRDVVTTLQLSPFVWRGPSMKCTSALIRNINCEWNLMDTLWCNAMHASPYITLLVATAGFAEVRASECHFPISASVRNI